MRHVTREMIEDKLKKIAKGVAMEGQYSGHATANGAMRCFRAIYNFAADRAPATNPLPQNPVKLKKVWLAVAPRTRSLSNGDVAKFYDSVCPLPNQVASDYLLLLLFTGLRRREAAGLRWEHVDLKDRVIRLPSSSTKAKRPLDLPMSDFVCDLLVARRALGSAAGWVFPAPSKSGHIEEPKFHLRQVHAACGIEVSCHDLRRTFVTVADLRHLPAGLEGAGEPRPRE